MTFLNKLLPQDHAELSSKEIGDSVVLFDCVFEIIGCDRSQDNNFIYDECIVVSQHPLQNEPHYFTYTIVYSIYGQEDYGYDPFAQDYSFIEVEKRETITYSWVQKL